MASSSPPLPDAAAKLLDFSQPFDVPLLDATINAFYGAGSNDERAAAEAVLEAVQSHPDAWSRVDAVLEHSRNAQSRFFALQILESVIKRRWGALPDEQRAGVRNFVSNMIISCASASETSKGSSRATRDERTFLHKLDVALVQILKQDWPHAWPSFVPDLCAASRASAPLCENSMVILKLLSEEVFDFSRGELTQAKTRELKGSLNTQFGAIHELCMFALAAGAGPLVSGGEGGSSAAPVSASLVRATLDTLHAYLSWVPLGYVFESDVVAALLRLFPVPAFRNASLKCLTEVAALSVGPERDAAFVSLATVFVAELAPMLPAESMAPQSGAEGGIGGPGGAASSSLSLVDPGKAVDHSRGLGAAYAAGSDEDQDFVQNLALFLTTFLRAHLRALEADPQARRPGGPLLSMLDLLASVSFVPDEEVFKICLDYWHHFVPGVYAGATAAAAMANAASTGGGFGSAGGFGLSPPLGGGGVPSAGGAGGNDVDARRLYARVLSRLRALMIARMAKPEEVIVVEDPESGAVVREAMKDTDTLARYKTMHETLVYLAHLDHEDTERQMHDALRAQLAAKNDWSWGGLNTLCWAVGSISGSMAEDQENRFLVTVIRDLLNLCEVTRGKDNKAVIAANIMYVVGQYPRFLRNHWKFLKTVVNKLFEFMHETHPGVQDMACETFLKICHKCRRKFVVQQLGEAEPFVCELLTGLGGTIQDLEAHQVHMFYEAVGLMVGADADQAKRASYLERLMAPPNATWDAVVSQALAADPSGSALLEPDRVKSVTNILQTNTSVCTSLGAPFAPQMARVFGDVLRVYALYSAAADAAIADGGPHAARSAGVKALRGAKRACLRLLETWVGACDDVALLAGQYVPAMAEPVLGAYARARSPESRDAEALALYAAVVAKLRSAAAADVVPRCFDAVFGPTLEMITANFEDFPEHRLQFFALLRSVAGAAFGALFGLGAAQLKLLVDAVVWAFRHTERNVAETGLNLLLDLLQAFERSPAAAQFYQTYYMHLVREIFAVMTDTFHKPGFKLHARILHHLFGLARPAAEGGLPAPLWEGAAGAAEAAGANGAAAAATASIGAVDPATGAPWASNAAFVAASVSALLSTSFPNLRPTQVEACCRGMFALRDFGAFKEHLRDFLVQTKSFASQDNADLFAEEAGRAAEAEAARLAAIPGMANPHTGAVAGVVGGGGAGGGSNGAAAAGGGMGD